MDLTPTEVKVILEEAQKAKDHRFCRQIFAWIGGRLDGVEYELKTDKDTLKARLNGNSLTK